ncbi:MAG: hypothetical protein WA584_20975 [Pyrinomonadaceae bacterium]
MSKKQCSANNRNGERCRAYANGNGVCFMHDTTKGRERALARRNGGLATKQPHYADAELLPAEVRKIEDVFTILNYALLETIGLDNSINRGRLLVSIAHGFIEALKVGEFEKRLESVEMALKLRKQNK